MFARNPAEKSFPERFRKNSEKSEGRRIVLDDAGWEQFLAALENPPEPSARLQEAYRKYRERNCSS